MSRGGMSAGRIVAIVFGAIAALIALVLLAGVGVLLWAHTTQRDDDGYYSTRYERFGSPGYAVSSDDLDLGTEGPDWLFEQGRLATIRLRGRNRQPRPLFLGIGRLTDVESYLRGVDHDVVADIDLDPFRVSYRHEPGSRPVEPPALQTFWAARGRNEVTWEVDEGRWVAVVMNADGSRGISADISVGAKSDLVLWAVLILLVLGALVGRARRAADRDRDARAARPARGGRAGAARRMRSTRCSSKASSTRGSAAGSGSSSGSS